MAHTTTARATQTRNGELFHVMLTATENGLCPPGSILCISTSTGDGGRPTAVTHTRVLGIVDSVETDSTTAGRKLVDVRRMVSGLYNNSGTSAVTKAHEGAVATIEDNQTIAAPGGTITGGIIIEVTSAGVWVQF